MKRLPGGRMFLLMLVLAAMLPAASAHASGIVFTKDDGNVWLAKPTGSGQVRVTDNGTSGNPYEGPSQADDGTIVAARGSGSGRRIYRLDQDGTPLNKPIATVGDVIEPRISPNGKLVAYWFLTPVSYTDCSYCIGVYDQTVYTYPQRLTRYEEVPGPRCCEQPSWMANQGVFLTNGSCTAWYHRLGDEEAREWFNDYDLGGDCRSYRDGEMSGALDRIALVRGDSQETLQLYRANGAPPANPTPGCTFTGASGGEFIGPTWSPDGKSLAWEESDGIVIAKIPSVTDCEAINAANAGGVPLIQGGHTPDWGPADVNPDRAAPIARLTAGPAAGAYTKDPTPTFAFAANEAGASFQCRVDGGSFARCGSPKTVGPLGEGHHTFYVRAIDRAGNVGAAVSRGFTVDTKAAALTITGPKRVKTRRARAKATFGFKASDPASFKCKVDRGALKTCSSPFTTPKLRTGRHKLTVQATDRARNVAKKTKAFRVVRRR